MNRLIISFFVPLMFVTAATSAQKKQLHFLQWKIAAELPPANGQTKALGLAGPVTGVHRDVLMVGGGANFPDSMPWQGGKKKYYDDVYVYVKEHRKIVLQPKTFKLPATIAYAASCSTPEGIVYAGGENENGISNKVILLQWDVTGQKIVSKNLPDLPVGVTNAVAMASGTLIYIAGGEMLHSVSDRFYCLDIGNVGTGWQQLPSLPKPVSHAVGAVQVHNGKEYIYLVGGRRKNSNGISDLYASVYEFDLTKNEWNEKKSLPYPLSAGTGLAAGNGCILLFGGDKGGTFHQVETLLADISAEKDEIKKMELVQKKNQLQATHPGFSRELLVYHTMKDEWTINGILPYDAPVTTSAVKWGKKILIPGGEIKAGVRTPRILEAKLNRKNK